MTAEDVAGDPAPGPGRARLRRLRAGPRGRGRERLRRPRGGRAPGARERPGPARPLAVPLRPPPRRRSPGRRPEPAARSPSCWPRRRTGSSSSATTTRASTAGGSPTSDASWGWPPTCPGLRRVDLAVNYRCPAPVLARAVRLVEHNRERFAKTIRAGPAATGRLVLAPVPGSTDPAERLLAGWPPDGASRAVLARTRRELLPIVAACLRTGTAFRADGVTLPLEDPRVDDLVGAAVSSPSRLPVAARVVAAARRHAAPPPPARQPSRLETRGSRSGAHLDRPGDRRRGDRLGGAARARRRPGEARSPTPAPASPSCAAPTPS